MNIVMIIPTGIGCEIGGHAGDATPAARLLGSVCDKIILHPNVVNASDINEMPSNALYVEGSSLDRFLQGTINLQEVTSNKILVATNKPVKPELVNTVSAARATLGINASIVALKTPLKMIGRFENGIATGDVTGVDELINQVGFGGYDALAVSTPIEVDEETKLRYFREGGVNPWGGVEAIASKMIAKRLGKPVAHAPLDEPQELQNFNEIVDPRMSAEMVSVTYLFCVLKGLHRAPRYNLGGFDDIGVDTVKAFVSPYGCWGTPHKACAEREIPIIVVRENRTVLQEDMGDCIFVENYFEAAGVVAAIRTGMDLKSIRRPLPETMVVE